MIKNYIREFSKDYREYHKEVRATGKWLNELIDKILVWILSLSTGSIVLLFSSIDKVKFASKESIDAIVILLTISIFAGVIGRVIYAVSIYINNELSESLESSLRALALPYHPYILRGDETAEEVYELIKVSFDLDLTLVIEGIKDMDSDKKKIHDQNVRQFYDQLKEGIKDDQQEALNIVNANMNAALGIRFKDKNKTSETIDRGNSTKRIITDYLENGSYILFAVCIVSFLTALIVTVVNFVN